MAMYAIVPETPKTLNVVLKQVDPDVDLCAMYVEVGQRIWGAKDHGPMFIDLSFTFDTIQPQRYR